MKLSQEGILLLGAVISLVTSLIITGVVYQRDLQAVEKRKEEKKLEDGLSELIIEFSEPSRFELGFESLGFGLRVGFFIFLIFWFISWSVQAN